MGRLQVQSNGDPAGASAGHHTSQFQVKEDVVDASLSHHQLLCVLIEAQAGCQEHAFQAGVAVPVQEPVPQLCCRKKWGYAERGVGGEAGLREEAPPGKWGTKGERPSEKGCLEEGGRKRETHGVGWAVKDF